MARVRVQVPGGNFKSIQVAQSTSGGQDPGSGSAQNPLTAAQQVAVANIVQAYSNSVAVQQQAAAASAIQSIAALAAGSTTQIQYNNAGALGASANFIWNFTDNYLSITNAATGSAAIQVAATSTDSVFGLGITAGSGKYAAISLAGNGNTYGSSDFEVYQDGSSNANLYNGADGAMQFYTDAALRLTLAANGDTMTFAAQTTGAGTGIYCDGGDITASRSTTSGILYLGSAGDYYVCTPGINSLDYGSICVVGATNAYAGVAADGNCGLTLMDTTTASTDGCGLYGQKAGGWLLYYDGTNVYGAGSSTSSISVDQFIFPGAVQIGTNKSLNPNLIVYASAAGDYGAKFVNPADSGTMEQIQFYIDGASGSQVGSISCTTSATSYTTSSDKRLKQNIKVASTDRAGEIMDALQVREFDWIRVPVHVEHGFIAQELNEVVPAAVSHNEKIDEWGVDHSKLVPVMIAEIKALRARVAALEHAAKS